MGETFSIGLLNMPVDVLKKQTKSCILLLLVFLFLFFFFPMQSVWNNERAVSQPNDLVFFNNMLRGLFWKP